MSEEKTEDVEVLTSGELLEAVQSIAQDFDGEELVVDEAFILDDNETLVASKDIYSAIAKHSMRCFDSDRIASESDLTPSGMTDIMKTVAGTTQTDKEVGSGNIDSMSLGAAKVVQPPYPPEILSSFLEVDSIHFRCVKTKVTDAVGRQFTIEPTTKKDNTLFDPNEQEEKDQKQIVEEIKTIRNFIQEGNRTLGFEGVLERVWMDYESIGWGAIEVIRSRDMKVKSFTHIPASRVRVLKGWKGFVEIQGAAKFRYYQSFGDKLVSKKRTELGNVELYNPNLDGELDASSAEWRMIDRDTGEPTNDFNKAANELIWIPKHHSNTIYYGMTDVIPALGDLFSNVNIRDYILQFFEHNTVPRYAIIIEGAKMAEPVQKLIMQYFNTHVKGKPHKTLIIPVPSMRGEVKVRFERLDADVKEADYQDTRKNQDQHIMTAHGVSPAIIGIAEHSELGSGKGLSQAEIYKDRIVEPSQRKADGAINRLLRLGLGITIVELRHIPLDIRDKEGEQRVLIGYQESGVMTINEVRLKAKLGDPLKGGNRAFIVTSRGIVFVDELSDMSGAGKMAEEEATRKHELEKEKAKQPVMTINGNGQQSNGKGKNPNERFTTVASKE